jgi:predicted transcriptional regulator of viral defense system
MKRLIPFGSVPIDASILKSVFSDYGYPGNKVSLLEQSGNLIRLKRGLYAVSPEVSGQTLSLELIANHMYGPSYVSMEYALRYYGLIPERVFEVKSMTSKRSRQFVNELATFTYIETTADYFPIGIRQVSDTQTFLIASPEKALCDLIAYAQGLRIQSQKRMLQYLEDDIRFDTAELAHFDPALIRQCVEYGKKKRELSILLNLLEK